MMNQAAAKIKAPRWAGWLNVVFGEASCTSFMARTLFLAQLGY